MSATLHATPFHSRAAENNGENCWVTRNGATLAQLYTGVGEEALAARCRVAIADISWRWRIGFQGARVVEFLHCLVTRDVSGLAPGAALKALWLSDGGGVRGAGLIARYGRESFMLVATEPDAQWIESTAATFNVTAKQVSHSRGGLAIIGPYARATLEAAGLDGNLELLTFRKLSWRGTEVTLSRWGEHGGYEIWCRWEDGSLIWDRLATAGAPFGLLPAGVAALEILDLEAGIPRPGRDYLAARDGDATVPSVRSLGLDALIDSHHAIFNGRVACLAGSAHGSGLLCGIQIESETPAPYTPLVMQTRPVGHTLSSLHSPSLRCAIALAQVEASAAKPGTALTLALPPSPERPELRVVAVRVVNLPFLPVPESIGG